MTTFGPLFVPQAVRDAVSDRAWLEAMLDAERALANASCLGGFLTADAAAAVADCCDPSLYDIDELAAAGRAVGNPVEPLVKALRDCAPDAHKGATSQDILDSAAMLVARSAVELALDELDAAVTVCAGIAREHRSTPMAARTLLQQAVPTTFGYTAARWLMALAEARAQLRALTFPAQLGGAAGTLAAFGEHGLDVVERFAAELDLAVPLVPWHADRAPVAAIATALGAAATSAAKVGLDVVLLAQTEVGEVREREGGGSSTMPHKHNPVRAVLARACARGAQAQVALLVMGEHEHERAAGAWQAEWPALSEALALTAGALSAARACLAGLEVDVERMRSNMTAGLYAEQRAFGAEGAYLGSAEALVDRVLAAVGE